jgi:hypothetical protein
LARRTGTGGPAFDPDIVVVTFGGNDAQFLADRSGATVVGQPRPDADNAAWTAEYRDRVARVVDYLDQDGRIVVWVGIPNHANPEVTFRMRHQDEAVKAELATSSSWVIAAYVPRIWRTPAWSLPAMSAASCWANGTSSSWATTWLTRPHASAVWASRKLPVVEAPSPAGTRRPRAAAP